MGNANRNGVSRAGSGGGWNEISLILYGVSLMENGAGSAWGMPVIREGKKRYSALAVSGALKKTPGEGGPAEKAAASAPGAELPDGYFFSQEELADIGIGPLGRFTGGEKIKPLPLKPEHFFEALPESPPWVFFSGVEFERDLWQAKGDFSSLFRSHLEFLRAWGFSGGLIVPGAQEEPAAPPEGAGPLAEYLRFLHGETAGRGGKILAAMEKRFFEASVLPGLGEAAPFAGTEGIPVNNAEGGESVLSAGITGTGIVLYEDLPPNVKTLSARCDVLLVVENEYTNPAALALIGEITSRLRLGIRFEGGRFADTPSGGTDTENRLFRSLLPAAPGGKPPALPLKPARAAAVRTGYAEMRRAESPLVGFSPPDREQAAALDLLPQWEAGRVENAGGAVFAVNARFAGIRAADFREEQSLYYAEAAESGGSPAKPGPEKSRPFAAPPEYGEAAFEKLDEKQRDYFLYWREQCRRGNYTAGPKTADPGMGAGYYVEVYARELILSMGHEDPMKGFLSLRDLMRGYERSCPGTGVLLFRWLVDFAAIYGIGREALGLLFDGLPPMLGEQEKTGKSDPALLMLLDIALFRFLVEEKRRAESCLPFIEKLIAPKARKKITGEGKDQFLRALDLFDSRLREEWDQGFFEFFRPPVPARSSFSAFSRCPGAGRSNYTALWLNFSGHRPLTSALEGLALNPASVQLPAGIRPFSFNIESNLLEQLRRESDEVRELLKTRDGGDDLFTQPALPFPSAYNVPDIASMEDFTASLSSDSRRALANLLEAREIGGLEADVINAAFSARFGDLLIVYDSPARDGRARDGRPSISGEYLSILTESWKSRRG